MTQFVTTHKLHFEAAPWTEMKAITQVLMLWGRAVKESPIVAFRVGTCEGIYQVSAGSYDIIAITNDQPGNGHFEDVLQWFEQSCRRDGKGLRFMEIMNKKFGEHLKNKRGFKRQRGTNHMIKQLRDI